MATIIAHNILSPLGGSSEETYQAVKAGRASLHKLERAFGTPTDITASVFSEEQRKTLLLDGYTWFESLAIRSIGEALRQTSVDVADSRACLILSTTKGDVEALGKTGDSTFLPGASAQRIARSLGFITPPIVVCNACISGVSALITASRLVDAGVYRQVVVCGCDVLGKFIVSGFESLKALSPDECRPFDEERIGLNLGEAASTLVLASGGGDWHVCEGAVCNDAYHISTPSPKGIGAGRALRRMGQKATWAFVNLHGTATMYNDQMEWKALELAEATGLPANAYKGYVGHTMGAAGLLECILSMLAVEDGVILGTRGFHASGVSGDIRMTPAVLPASQKSFVKLISGFGGCNAAVRLSMTDTEKPLRLPGCKVSGSVKITPHGVEVNHQSLPTKAQGMDLLTELYQAAMGDYPRFYRMDNLSRLGMVACELLLRALPDFTDFEHTAVVLFNRSSSLCADKHYWASICDADNYYPSPSAFVYTLPNMVDGEIAIRHQLHEETAFYILPEKDRTIMETLVRTTLSQPAVSCCITGWIDCFSDTEFEGEMYLFVEESTCSLK